MKSQKELIKELKELIKLQATKQSDNKHDLKKTLHDLAEKIKENPGIEPWRIPGEFNISMQLEYTKASRKFNNRIHLLAYGLLRGLPYRAMENTTKDEPEWLVKHRAKHVYVIYSAHYSEDNRIQRLSEEDIRRAFHGGNDDTA